MMRIVVILTVSILMSGVAVADELQRLSLDDISKLGTIIQTDRIVKTEGAGSVKITTQHPTTICLGSVSGMDVENSRLVYQASVKSEIKGSAYLEMWAHVGEGQYYSKGLNNPVKGTSDWKTIQTPFIFQKGQNPTKVVLNLVVNGHGTVWIDDVVLAKSPL